MRAMRQLGKTSTTASDLDRARDGKIRCNRASLAGWILAATVACSGRAGVADGPSARRGTDPGAPRLDQLLEKRCGACHNAGDASLPAIGAGIDLSPRQSIRAAEIIAAGVMPPDGRLALRDRRELIAGLCQLATRQAKRCADALDPSAGRVARPHTEMLRALHAIRPDRGDGRSLLPLVVSHLDGSAAPPLTVSYVLQVALIAIQRCRSDPQAGCLKEMLDPRHRIPRERSATPR